MYISVLVDAYVVGIDSMYDAKAEDKLVVNSG